MFATIANANPELKLLSLLDESIFSTSAFIHAPISSKRTTVAKFLY